MDIPEMVFERLFTYLKRVISRGTSVSDDDLTNDLPALGVTLTTGDIAIDCGANVGDITAIMANSGATVYTFEPNPFAFEVLRDRFVDTPNVFCINKGVLDRNGRMRLFLHRNAPEDQVRWSGGSSLLDFKGNIDKESFVECEVVDLARFIVDLEKEIKIVKMDVEGVEYRIIHHLIDTGVIRKIEHLLVEAHESKIPALREAAQLLKERVARVGLTNISFDWV